MSDTLKPPPFWVLATHNLVVGTIFGLLGVTRNAWLLGLFAAFNLSVWALFITPVLGKLGPVEWIWFACYASLEIAGYVLAAAGGYRTGPRTARWIAAGAAIVAAAALEWGGMIWL